MRIYIAASFQDWSRAKDAREELQAAGHAVTSDWIDVAEKRAGRCDGAAAVDYNPVEHALDDLGGVEDANVLLVLTPDDKALGCGMWIELGYALALAKWTPKTVVIAGAQRDRSIFCALADERHLTDAAAVSWIIALGKERAA